MAQAAADGRAVTCLDVVSAPSGDVMLQRIADTLAARALVEDLVGLGDVLDRETRRGPRVLELIGHSTPVDRVLCLGTTVLAADDAAVIRFFRARRGRLAELEITAIRLLGCCTAVRSAGQAAMRAIADAAAIDVYGSITILSDTAYDRDGLRACYAAAYLADQDHPPVDAVCLLD